jgi:hypothetical protein
LKEEDTLAVKLWKLLGALVLFAVSIYLSTYTVQHLWQWFVVPLFSVPVLGLLQAMGLAMFVRYLTKGPTYYVEREDAYKDRLIHSIMHPVLALGVGYVVHLYI